MSLALHIVSKRDPIILHGYDWGMGVTPFSNLLPFITKEPATLLLSLSWTSLVDIRFQHMLSCMKEYLVHRPKHRFVLLANMQQEKKLFDAHGLQSIFCPHNTFLNEDLYTIEDAEKQWNGVINSRILRFKRIHLLKDVENCCLISYKSQDYDEEYEEELQRDLPHLYRPQYKDKRPQIYFQPKDLSYHYSRSKCGLILSEVEGGCFAASEYLLCGLPVVTTPNVGGRNVFFHQDYAYLADASYDGVKKAVHQAQHCALSPQEIRRQCLYTMLNFRDEYMNMLYKEAHFHGFGSTFSLRWDDFYVNKLFTYFPRIEDAVLHLIEEGICLLPPNQ